MAAILIVEDEAVFGKSLARFLSGAGYDCTLKSRAEDGLHVMEEVSPHAVLLDVRLPGMDGLQALRAFQQQDADLPVIMVTAYGTIETAVEAMRAGAADYLCKPLDLQEVRLVLERALDNARNRRRLSYYQGREAALAERTRMVGDCPAMQQVFRLVDRFTRIGSGSAGEMPTVLILGETGTGKGLVARAIHAQGPASQGPFVEVNCTTLPRDLIEAELFGYEKGAYTGATESKPGLAEAAEGGTLFLDEVGELPLAVQVKLLQLIENKAVRRVGGLRTRNIPMRIIAATNRDLEALSGDGTFRQDLLYRLKVLPVELPPLRRRGGDVLLLAEHFLRTFSRKYATPGNRLSPAAVEALCGYDWPGNVRELAHVMERAVLLSDRPVIGAEFIGLPEGIGNRPDAAPEENGLSDLTLEEAERRLISEALTASKGNVSEAARRLGISRETMRYRLQKHAIVPNGPA